MLFKGKKKIIFISWTDYGRHTFLLGEALKAKIYFIKKSYKDDKTFKSIKLVWDYLLKSLQTIFIIIKSKPDVVFVQNPPSIAPILLVMISKVLKFKVIIDSHNGAFEEPWINIPFHKWALKNAFCVTIHNIVLYNHLRKIEKLNDVNFHILNSRIPEFSRHIGKPVSDKYFLIISSFAGDEPMMDLLEGINLFLKKSNNFSFKITGNFNRQPYVYEKFKKIRGIDFLGFISEDKFQEFLTNAFGVISVSIRDDVQQFSLMEAIGAGVPFISNKNLTNRILFKDKMILIDMNAQSIVEGISIFINKKNELDNNIITLKNKLNEKWELDFNELLRKIENVK